MEKPEHEKLFDEICNKLNELSQNSNSGFVQEHKFEKMQTQIKKFQNDLSDTSTELNEKIKSLESVSYVQTDFSTQLKQMNDQLTFERSVNTKLSTDLAKSLELCLQLQLEIQNIKTKAVAIQNEERKYSQGLLEKSKGLLSDLELSRALNEDLRQEIDKSKEAQRKTQDEVSRLAQEKAEVISANEALLTTVNEKDQHIERLNTELEELSNSLNSMEGSSRKQSEALKNLMSVAESKMIELKLALDKKSLEAQDYHSQLQHSQSQSNLFKQENIALKDYINKLTVYQQEMQKMFQQEAHKSAHQSHLQQLQMQQQLKNQSPSLNQSQNPNQNHNHNQNLTLSQSQTPNQNQNQTLSQNQNLSQFQSQATHSGFSSAQFQVSREFSAREGLREESSSESIRDQIQNAHTM